MVHNYKEENLGIIVHIYIESRAIIDNPAQISVLEFQNRIPEHNSRTEFQNGIPEQNSRT